MQFILEECDKILKLWFDPSASVLRKTAGEMGRPGFSFVLEQGDPAGSWRRCGKG